MKQLILIALIVLIANAAIDSDRVTTNIQQFPKIANVFQGEWYSGFLDVEGVKAHYWFFVSDFRPTSKPIGVQMWMNYGPQCSGIYHAIKSIAPFNLQEGSTNILKNENTWYELNHLLIIDPPGMGFSEDDESVEQWSDQLIVEFNYKALKKWLEGFDEHKDNLFYFGGEGDGANYAIKTADYIRSQSILTGGLKIQIDGVLLGNPAVNISQNPEYTQYYPFYLNKFLKNMGIISESVYEQWPKHCPYTGSEVKNGSSDLTDLSDECKAHIKTLQDRIYGINLTNISKNCYYKRDEDSNYTKWSCDDKTDAQSFFDEAATIKNLLHVGDDQVENYKFKICNRQQKYDKKVTSAKASLTSIMKHGIATWIFQGDQDAIITLESTYNLIQDLREEQGLSDIVNYSSWYYNPSVDDHTQNGGNFWKMDRLTFVRFKGCGNNACGCNPVGCLQMYDAFKYNHLMIVDPLKSDIYQ